MISSSIKTPKFKIEKLYFSLGGLKIQGYKSITKPHGLDHKTITVLRARNNLI